MNILVITPFLPGSQATSGCPRAVFDRLRLLAGDHHFDVLCFASPGEVDGARELAEMGVGVHCVPRETTGGRGPWRKRASLLLGLLFGRCPLLVLEFRSRAMRDTLRTQLGERDFDLLLVEHTLMAQYMNDIDTGMQVPVVFSEHDARLALPSRLAPSPANGHGPFSTLRRMLARIDRGKWRRYEARACLRADRVLVPTKQDQALLARLAPGIEPVIVPYGMAPTPAERTEENRDPDMVLFVGNFDHSPNVDAAVWLADEIMPGVWRERPSAHLWIVGKNPTPRVSALAGDRVTVTGQVPSVAPYLRRCAVFAAPVRLGAGTRMKVLEAMLHSAAVVTTPLGTLGLDLQPGVDALVAEGASAFARAVLTLLGDPGMRDAVGRSGHASARSADKDRARRDLLNDVLRQAAAAGPHGTGPTGARGAIG